jgi:serine/threonine protein kinase
MQWEQMRVEDLRSKVLAPGVWVGGRYQVKRPIGRGGFGQVYLATSGRDGRLVALKVSRAACEDVTLRGRLEREARIGQSLTDIRCVRVLDWGEDMRLGICFLCMEYVEGEPISDWLRGGERVAVDRVVWVVEEAARGLEEAHQKGLVHRDIKPANVMVLERQGKMCLKLIDWGIARWIDGLGMQPDGVVTGDEVILGTAHYMAPEQARRQALDGRADQYALAVMAFEMLTGRLPFEGARPFVVIHKHLNEKPPLIAQVKPGLRCGEALDLVLQKALSKRAEDRFGGVIEFAEALREAVEANETVPFSSGSLRAIRATFEGDIDKTQSVDVDVRVGGLGVVKGGEASVLLRTPRAAECVVMDRVERRERRRGWMLVVVPALYVVFVGLLVQWLMER